MNEFTSLGHSFKTSSDFHQLVLTKTPMWWAALDTVVTMWLCMFTGHRFCNARLTRWVDRLVRAHTSEFAFDASDELLAAYYEWMSWGTPYWMDPDDDAVETEDDEVDDARDYCC